MYDTLLFLHLLSAFVLVTSEVLFTTTILAGHRAAGAPGEPGSPLRLLRFAVPTVAVGSIGVLVFGIWLAIYRDEYQVWDGWILAAIVLWAVWGALGGYIGKIVRRAAAAGEVVPRSRLLTLDAASWALVVLLLLDMIFKPGA
ncbi:MAG: hypothetical protein QOF50_897 [Gaiellaceae bacterium]|nr:hypothetical protein [Gaiellaceae bacterium]